MPTSDLLQSSIAGQRAARQPEQSSGLLQGDAEIPGSGTPVALVNRASASRSPYVQEHADSLVAWQLLDAQAVELARVQEKPIFMHIGYKSCHFSRLTKLDAFSNPACADILNDAFIPILVDRDERPDIDAIYINYVQGLYQTAGWPLNLFLTPELQPIYGDTYIPLAGTERRGTLGMGGVEIDRDDSKNFVKVLAYLEKVWAEQRARCRTDAQSVTMQLINYAAEGTLGTKAISLNATGIRSGISGVSSAVGASSLSSTTRTTTGPTELDLDELETAYTKLAGTFDPTYGGFGLSPKHITPPKLAFLLRLARFPAQVQDVVGESECARATEMVLITLRHIRDGALRDHVGGQGFARYSLTADWSIPNFEKLVGDNALLLSLFVDAWLVGGGTKSSEFYDVMVELGTYLSTAPISLPDGGFATAEAADSYPSRSAREMQEGAYYLWTRREFDAVVGNDDLASMVAAAYWNVLEDGNVDPEQDPNDDFINQNILRVVRSMDIAEAGRQVGISESEATRLIDEAKAKLAAHREKERPRPEIDDKVVSAYNGLVISALARAGAAVRYVDESVGKSWIEAAAKAAAFVRANLWDEQQGVLYRLYHDGTRGETEGFADDYAFIIEGLIELFEATGEEKWLQWADELQVIQHKRFYDGEKLANGLLASAEPCGGFYSTVQDAPFTLLRLKDGMDTALPSTNGVSASNLFRLGAILSNQTYVDLARETVSAFEVETLQHPWLFPGLLAGVVNVRLGGKTWVVLGGGEDAMSKKVIKKLRTSPAGGVKNLIVVPTGSDGGGHWLVGKNKQLRELVEKGESGCFFWIEGGYRPAREEDLEDEAKYEE